MAFRNDLDAAHSRVSALEQELAETKAELEGKREKESQALVKVGSHALARSEAESPVANRWLGAPTLLGYTRTIEGDIPETAHTELVEKMRLVLGSVGSTTVLPGSLAWGAAASQNGLGPNVNIYVSYGSGRTKIRADQKLGNLAGGIFGGVGGGVGGGGLVAPIMTMLINPLIVPIAIGAWLGGTYWACRKLYRSRAAVHAGKLEDLLDELVEICERHIVMAADQES